MGRVITLFGVFRQSGKSHNVSTFLVDSCRCTEDRLAVTSFRSRPLAANDGGDDGGNAK